MESREWLYLMDESLLAIILWNSSIERLPWRWPKSELYASKEVSLTGRCGMSGP